MKKILKWLSGKKSFIFGLCGVIIVYCQGEGVMSANLAVAIQGFLTIIAGGTSYATGKYIYNTK